MIDYHIFDTKIKLHLEIAPVKIFMTLTILQCLASTAVPIYYKVLYLMTACGCSLTLCKINDVCFLVVCIYTDDYKQLNPVIFFRRDTFHRIYFSPTDVFHEVSQKCPKNSMFSSGKVADEVLTDTKDAAGLWVLVRLLSEYNSEVMGKYEVVAWSRFSIKHPFCYVISSWNALIVAFKYV